MAIAPPPSRELLEMLPKLTFRKYSEPLPFDDWRLAQMPEPARSTIFDAAQEVGATTFRCNYLLDSFEVEGPGGKRTFILSCSVPCTARPTTPFTE